MCRRIELGNTVHIAQCVFPRLMRLMQLRTDDHAAAGIHAYTRCASAARLKEAEVTCPARDTALRRAWLERQPEVIAVKHARV
jgi:hypothetical protein